MNFVWCALRALHDKTQAEVAKAAGITQSYYSQIERGQHPSGRLAARLLAALPLPNGFDRVFGALDVGDDGQSETVWRTFAHSGLDWTALTCRALGFPPRAYLSRGAQIGLVWLVMVRLQVTADALLLDDPRAVSRQWGIWLSRVNSSSSDPPSSPTLEDSRWERLMRLWPVLGMEDKERLIDLACRFAQLDVE